MNPVIEEERAPPDASCRPRSCASRRAEPRAPGRWRCGSSRWAAASAARAERELPAELPAGRGALDRRRAAAGSGSRRDVAALLPRQGRRRGPSSRSSASSAASAPAAASRSCTRARAASSASAGDGGRRRRRAAPRDRGALRDRACRRALLVLDLDALARAPRRRAQLPRALAPAARCAATSRVLLDARASPRATCSRRSAKTAGARAQSVAVFDRYEGRGVPEGKREPRVPARASSAPTGP